MRILHSHSFSSQTTQTFSFGNNANWGDPREEKHGSPHQLAPAKNYTTSSGNHLCLRVNSHFTCKMRRLACSLLFSCYDKTPWQRLLMAGRVYLGLESVMAGKQGAGLAGKHGRRCWAWQETWKLTSWTAGMKLREWTSSKKDISSQIPSGILPAASPHLANLPLTAPPTGDQMFTCPRLWKTFFTQTSTAGF